MTNSNVVKCQIMKDVDDKLIVTFKLVFWTLYFDNSTETLDFI